MSEAQPAAVEPSAQVTPEAILQLGLAFWGSKTLLSAIELGVFSELADASSLDGDALRERLGLHARSATDFFDALVALGMLKRTDGRYSNAPSHATTRRISHKRKPVYAWACRSGEDRCSRRMRSSMKLATCWR